MQELVLDDVYDVWYTSFWQTSLGYAILIGLAVAAIIFAYVLTKIIIGYMQGTTKDRALRALNLLAERVKRNHVDSRKVYQELTDTIKSYTRWRYGIPRGVTDYELTALLADAGCEKEHQEHMQRIVADAQAVKFGRIDALRQQVQKDIADVVLFIQETGEYKH